jgi:methylenetetrahydrofolate dehydrogenase (NADP+)/methenyltetrahydrofolate cyclohydrolase
VLVPATPLAVVKILEYYGIDMQGKNAVIIGRGIAVGKPLSLLLLNRNATVTVCHTKTVDIPSIAKKADLLVSAVGKAGLVTCDYVNENAVVIDVGLSFENGVASGDVDFDSVSQKCSAVSPVPGGVGPVTRACLFYNTLIASKNK